MQVFMALRNKILNKIHDATDAFIMDSNGYGGHGVIWTRPPAW
jgi:hypothetical protein